jgi:hypothetical protein
MEPDDAPSFHSRSSSNISNLCLSAHSKTQRKTPIIHLACVWARMNSKIGNHPCNRKQICASGMNPARFLELRNIQASTPAAIEPPFDLRSTTSHGEPPRNSHALAQSSSQRHCPSTALADPVPTQQDHPLSFHRRSRNRSRSRC